MTVVCREGQVHDFRIFKEHQIEIDPKIEILADSGYRGIQKKHPNSRIPIRKKNIKIEQKKKKNTTKN